MELNYLESWSACPPQLFTYLYTVEIASVSRKRLPFPNAHDTTTFPSLPKYDSSQRLNYMIFLDFQYIQKRTNFLFGNKLTS